MYRKHHIFGLSETAKPYNTIPDIIVGNDLRVVPHFYVIFSAGASPCPTIICVSHINRATNLIFRKNCSYCHMSERSRTLVRRVSEGGDRGNFNKNQLDKLEFRRIIL